MSNFIRFGKGIINKKYITGIFVDNTIEGLRWNKKPSVHVKTFVSSSPNGLLNHYLTEEFENVEQAEKRLKDIEVQLIDYSVYRNDTNLTSL
jgi:hypothetical protein